jgi:hypothetical protein
MKKQITKKIEIEITDNYTLASSNKKQKVICLRQLWSYQRIPSTVYLTKSQIEKIYKESMKLLKEND